MLRRKGTPSRRCERWLPVSRHERARVASRRDDDEPQDSETTPNHVKRPFAICRIIAVNHFAICHAFSHRHPSQDAAGFVKEIGAHQRRVIYEVTRCIVRRLIDDEISALFFRIRPA